MLGYQIYHHNDITVRITRMLRKPRKHVRTTVQQIRHRRHYHGQGAKLRSYESMNTVGQGQWPSMFLSSTKYRVFILSDNYRLSLNTGRGDALQRGP